MSGPAISARVYLIDPLVYDGSSLVAKGLHNSYNSINSSWSNAKAFVARWLVHLFIAGYSPQSAVVFLLCRIGYLPRFSLSIIGKSLPRKTFSIKCLPRKIFSIECFFYELRRRNWQVRQLDGYRPSGHAGFDLGPEQLTQVNAASYLASLEK